MRARARPPESDAAGRPDAREAAAALGATIEELLHSGSVFDVHRARLADGNLLAVKLTRPAYRHDPRAAALLEREHAVLDAARGPGVVGGLGYAERGGHAALGLEYLPGGDLVPLAGEPPAVWAPAALDVLRALTRVHACGYIHADVKARNVLLGGADRARLVDFGSAMPIGRARPRGGRTRAHEPLRFVPERAEPAVDVHAFAVLVYELAAGRLPFGPAPRSYAPPPPLAGPDDPAPLRALAARVATVLAADDPSQVGTLLDFADVIESVHGEAMRAGASA